MFTPLTELMDKPLAGPLGDIQITQHIFGNKQLKN